MKSENRIVSGTAEELKEKIARGQDRSDWERVRKMTDAEVDAAVASDPDEACMIVDWKRSRIEPVSKAPMTMRVDSDVLAYFRNTGRGWQTRINAVLRSYVEHQR